MTKQNLYTLVLALPLCAIACTEAGDVKPPLDDGPMTGGADDVGELPPVDPKDPPVPLPSGYCVTSEDPPYQGIRHQCGGTIDLSITGEAWDTPVDQAIYLNFGPETPGDSYEHPLVAACCGEYDYEQLASSQPAYWENCLYDAIQQSCSAVPYYVWDMAEAAAAANKLVLADQLTKLGNDLSSGERQYECINAFWVEGPVDFFNVITDRHWNPAYDVWINLDFLEILDVSLPEDPSEWLTCKSIFENDDTVIPDIHPGPVWSTLGLKSGSLDLSGDAILATLVPDESSELLIGRDSSGVALLGALQLHGGPTRVEGVEIERWGIRSLRSVAMVDGGDGSVSIPAGALSLVAAVVVDGDTLSMPATNHRPMVLRENPDGWAIDGFSVVYTQDNGDAWTLDSSTLVFDLR